MNASHDFPHENQFKDSLDMEHTDKIDLAASPIENPEKSLHPNPFDPAMLRIDPSLDIELGAKKIINSVDVHKPSPQGFFRTHPDGAYRMPIAIIELKGTREFYAVSPPVANLIPDETKRVELRTCITRAGDLFLWPVALPSNDGRDNVWHASARNAAEMAETRWIRLKANIGAGRNDVFAAPIGIPDPIWPDIEFSELLRLAFGNGKLIDTLDHPVIKSLKGQI